MSNINLLPWREELRQVKNRKFFSVLTLTVVVSGFFVLCVDLWLGRKIDVLSMNVGYIEGALKVVDAQIKQIQNLKKDKQELMNRMQVIRSLQFDRVSVVQLLDLLPRVISESIYLTEVDRTERQNTPNAQDSKGGNDILSDLSKIVLNANDSASSDQKAPDQRQYLIVIRGIASSNNAISALLKGLSDVKWISDVQLDQVKESDKTLMQGVTGFEFVLQFVQNLDGGQ